MLSIPAFSNEIGFWFIIHYLKTTNLVELIQESIPQNYVSIP